MEKDDKIRNQQAKMKKYAAIGLVATTLLACLYSLNKHSWQAQGLRQDIVKMEQIVLKNGGGGDNNGDGNVDASDTASYADKIADLEAKVKDLDEEVRAIKKTGVIMETDPRSIQKTAQLQAATLELLRARYGNHKTFRVRVDLEFQPTIPDFQEKGKDGHLVIEMAPVDLIPVSVYNFLEIARTWIRGAFHRNANHVLQVQAVSDIHKSLPFQEYSSKFPHVRGTTGYAGRPSGPGWYVSIMDNSINHGPGSQQSENPYEADANFGKVVEGMDDVVPRIHSVKQMGWLSEANQIKIIKKTILVPDSRGTGFVEWKDPLKDDAATR